MSQQTITRANLQAEKADQNTRGARHVRNVLWVGPCHNQRKPACHCPQ